VSLLSNIVRLVFIQINSK